MLVPDVPDSAEEVSIGAEASRKDPSHSYPQHHRYSRPSSEMEKINLDALLDIHNRGKKKLMGK